MTEQERRGIEHELGEVTGTVRLVVSGQTALQNDLKGFIEKNDERIIECQRRHGAELVKMKEDLAVNKTRLGMVVGFVSIVVSALANSLGRWLVK